MPFFLHSTSSSGRRKQQHWFNKCHDFIYLSIHWTRLSWLLAGSVINSISRFRPALRRLLLLLLRRRRRRRRPLKSVRLFDLFDYKYIIIFWDSLVSKQRSSAAEKCFEGESRRKKPNIAAAMGEILISLCLLCHGGLARGQRLNSWHKRALRRRPFFVSCCR